jgi:hypothetical protein
MCRRYLELISLKDHDKLLECDSFIQTIHSPIEDKYL